MDAELEPLLRLALVQGIGPGRLARLLETFGAPEAVLRASPARLRAVPGIGEELARRVRDASGPAQRTRVSAAIDWMGRAGVEVLTTADRRYPEALLRLPDPPYLLFLRGDVDQLAAPTVAIVGTRSPTPYGREAAYRLSRDLAERGQVVVSGLARGIDTAAHRGALDGSGRTVAVLGHGIDRVYPPENRPLFSRITSSGLLLTEYPPGEGPRAGNFPRRNRLITALSRAVLVVEMGLRSGAQHTVTFALEQGREVFAVPGPIGSGASEGTNQLIKDGARLVTSARDVMEELDGVGPDRPSGSPGCAEERGLWSDLERRMLALLSVNPRHVDELIREVETDPGATLGCLLDLELRGVVRQLPGKLYVTGG
jgi:DNA processing protein